jgi:hypothetical protein
MQIRGSTSRLQALPFQIRALYDEPHAAVFLTFFAAI